MFAYVGTNMPWYRRRLGKIGIKWNDKVYVSKFDWGDIFDLDVTFAHIIAPGLVTFRNHEYAGFTVNDADLPEHLRYSEPYMVDNKYVRPLDDDDVLYKERFHWIMDEIIFAFQSKIGQIDTSYMSVPNPHYDPSKQDMYSDEHGLHFNLPKQIDRDLDDAFDDRVRNGFLLFGKYYQAFWF